MKAFNDMHDRDVREDAGSTTPTLFPVTGLVRGGRRTDPVRRLPNKALARSKSAASHFLSLTLNGKGVQFASSLATFG
jgi:hypothetical protein